MAAEKRKKIAETLQILMASERAETTSDPQSATVNIFNINLTIESDPDAPLKPIFLLGRID